MRFDEDTLKSASHRILEAITDAEKADKPTEFLKGLLVARGLILQMRVYPEKHEAFWKEV